MSAARDCHHCSRRGEQRRTTDARTGTIDLLFYTSTKNIFQIYIHTHIILSYLHISLTHTYIIFNVYLSSLHVVYYIDDEMV